MQRRIDALGRIVIPKEIRKVLKLEEGDYMNIFIDNDMIRLEKDKQYQMDKQINTILKMMEAHYGTKILFISNHHRNHITSQFYEEVKCCFEKEFKGKRIFIDDLCEYQGLIYPLMNKQEWFGSFILLNKSKNTNTLVLSYLCELLKQK